jgi:hypothetical protein
LRMSEKKSAKGSAEAAQKKGFVSTTTTTRLTSEADAIAKVRRWRPRRGAAWPRERRVAAAGGWTAGEAAAYPGQTAGEGYESERMVVGERRATAWR